MTDSPARWPLLPDPERDVVLDTRSLRAVSHPVRLRILGLLRMEGSSTATALAAQLGLNSGATSYHLRQLAAAGLIVEEVERGTGRDRWWRAAHRSSFLKLAALPDDDKETSIAYLHALALVYAEKMQRAAEERPMLPEEWQDVGMFGDYALLLTPVEAKRLINDIKEVLSRYRATGERAETQPEQPPPGAEPFHLQLQAFLRPGRDLTERGLTEEVPDGI